MALREGRNTYMQPIDVYGALVKQQHALNETIAPLEKTSQASAAHSVGTQLIYNGVLYDVTTNIAVGDTLTVGTNISVADDITTQISSVNTALTNEVTTRATLGAHNLFNIEDWFNSTGATYTLSDGVYTVSSLGNLAVTLYQVFDEPTDIKVYGTFSSSNNPRIDFYDENDTLIATYSTSSSSGMEIDGVVKIKFNYSTGSTFTFTNIMMCLQSDTDSTYQPYAMTNQELTNELSNQILYFTGQTCNATTGNFCTISSSEITSDHVVTECVFTNPSYITTDVTWTTSSGSLVLNGTCSTATTVSVTLAKKGN